MAYKKRKKRSRKLIIFYIALTLILIVCGIKLAIYMIFMPMAKLEPILFGLLIVLVGVGLLLFTNKDAELTMKRDIGMQKWGSNMFGWPLFPVLWNKTLYVLVSLFISLIVIAFGILIMLGIIGL